MRTSANRYSPSGTAAFVRIPGASPPDCGPQAPAKENSSLSGYPVGRNSSATSMRGILPIFSAPMRGQTAPVAETRVLSEALEFFAKHPSALLPDEGEIRDRAVELDNALLPKLASAENLRLPDLKLRIARSAEEFGELVNQAFEGRTRVVLRAPMVPGLGDWFTHYLAAEIYKGNGSTSVVIIDSSAHGERTDWVITLLNQLLPEGTKGIYIPTGQQKSAVGCCIFSISFALKMHRFKSHMDSLHLDMREDEYEEGWKIVTILDARASLPADFFKHAQSFVLSREVAAAHEREIMITKKGHTLVERFFKHIRADGASNSIDDKRRALIKRADPFAYASYTNPASATQEAGPSKQNQKSSYGSGPVSCDHIPRRGRAPFRAKDVIRGVVDYFKAEHPT